MNKQTGGPAFPQHYKLSVSEGDGGMTLRDYFAGLAMQAFISLPEASGHPDEFAIWAYDQADAMLEARDK